MGQEADRHFIVMEFLDGRTLRAEMDATGAMKPERAVEVAGAILKALEFAHSNGVIHRDVKPENIQMLENGQIKLTDFGIARLTFEPNLTMDGQVFGTPSYMSPEQIHGKEIDARSDVFSVGIILYEMVAGKKAFAGDSVVAITYAIMNSEPVQPQGCPYGLWKVIKTALEKTPSQRYADAGQMSEALRNCLTVSTPTQTDPNYGIPGQPWTAGGGQTHTPFAGNQSYGSPTQPTAFGGGQIVVPTGAVNPYAPPVQTAPPMPTYSPPVQAYGQANTQPYGQPNTQPYGQTYAQPQNQAYVPTTYAPYAPMPVTPVPVYYPPPPRKPLFKAETLDLMANVFKVVVFLGIAIALILFGINALSKGAPAQPAKGPTIDPVQQANSNGPSSQLLPGTTDAVNGAIVKDAIKPSANADPVALIKEGEDLVEQAGREDFPTKRSEIMASAHAKFASAIQADPATSEGQRKTIFNYLVNKVDREVQAKDQGRVRFFASQARSYAGKDEGDQALMKSWEDWIRDNPEGVSPSN